MIASDRNEVAGWLVAFATILLCGLAPLTGTAQLRHLSSEDQLRNASGVQMHSGSGMREAPASLSATNFATCSRRNPEGCSLDERILYRLATSRNGAARVTMSVIRTASIPVMVGVAPLSVVITSVDASGPKTEDAWLLFVSEATAGAAVYLSKRIVRRDRPFVAHPDLADRAGVALSGDSYSMPSGHSAVAFAVAASASLSGAPIWLTVPAYTWAGATAISRVWFAMHYPSDVVVGALVGVLSSVVVHQIGSRIVPQSLRSSPDSNAATIQFLSIRF